MAITTLEFLGFCILTVLLFILFPRKYRWISLLISSIAFYIISAKAIAVFIVITSFTTWLSALLMDKVRLKSEEALKAEGLTKEDKKEIKKKTQGKRKVILVITLIFNIGILVALKLLNYFSAALTAIVTFFAGASAADAFTLIMPLGISYYTFATIGYILDIYWKRYEVEKNFARFFLFASYYPHILQGPISRYNLLGKELKKPALYFKWDNFVIGMESILLGLFKKLVIAERCSIFVSNTLLEKDMSGMIYILAMILDGIQIYSDFSGYMDIVSGISKMFDVELEKNFNHPFMAKTVPEFWRRWHMSLGSWFKDYVYYPLSMSKITKGITKKSAKLKSNKLKKLLVVLIPVYVTWLLTGLWHGTGPGYVMWGVYYGTLIAISVTFSDDIQKLLVKLNVRTEVFSYRVFQTIKMFTIFMGGRFLATSMGLSHRIHIANQIWNNFFNINIFEYGINRANFDIIVIGVVMLIAIAVIEAKENIFEWFNKQNRIFCAIILYILIFGIFMLGIYGEGYSANFMYQRF